MKRFILLTALVFEFSALAQGTTQTVVPFGLENQNGNTVDESLSHGSLLQELFRGSYLETTWRTPILITGIAFRAKGVGPSYSAVVPRVEIRLSTSTYDPANMSLFYAVNKGADETTVYLHDNVALFAPSGSSPNPFDLKFAFDRPFVYDPKQGNLLMFFKTAQPSPSVGTRLIDSHFVQGSEIGYVGNSGPFSDNQVAPYSLVTQFTWTAIPEPSTWHLFGIGFFLTTLGTRVLRKK
jgi:hypothetical protein